MAGRKCVLLHGPRGVGKTRVGDVLLGRIGRDASRAILDLPSGEVRSAGCYPELEGRRERMLLIELESGEPCPPNSAKRQPTRNPAEWLQVIREQGRQFSAFLLWAEWCVVAERLRPRGPAAVEEGRVWHKRFEKRREEVCFPGSAAICEERIDTTGLGPEEVADLILGRIGEERSC